jgi:hypothetical protein
MCGMNGLKTYAGGCHCGKVRYETQLDLGGQLITCNCSICGKTGTVLAFTPAEHFTLRSGEEVLTDYQFGKKNIHHLFCSTCGVRSFARGTMPDGTRMCAVNVRCLDDVDVSALKVTPVDGKRF